MFKKNKNTLFTTGLILSIFLSFFFVKLVEAASYEQLNKGPGILSINYISQSVVLGEGSIVAVGTAPAESEIIAQILDPQKQVISKQETLSSKDGYWSISINQGLDVGSYQLLVTAINSYSQVSSSVVSDFIKIIPRPTLVLGSFEINQTWFFLCLIILLSVAFVGGWHSYDSWLGQVDRRVVIAKRDVENVFENIENNIDSLLKNYVNNHTDKCDLNNIKDGLKKIKNNLKKSGRYVVDNIKDIGK